MGKTNQGIYLRGSINEKIKLFSHSRISLLIMTGRPLVGVIRMGKRIVLDVLDNQLEGQATILKLKEVCIEFC